MKSIFLFALLLAVSLSSFSQVTEAEEKLKKRNEDTIMGWKFGGLISISFTQVSLTNWAAGGENSLGENSFVNLFLINRKEKATWENTLDLGYGTLKQGDAKWSKTEDRIDFSSKYGKRIKKGLYYAGLVNFKSQFAPGYRTPEDSVRISDFLAPGYVVGALGIDYKPFGSVSAFIAPITMKTTLVMDQELADAGAFGVDKAVYGTDGALITKGKNSRIELGGYLKILYKKEFIKKSISFSSRLELFSNYLEDPEDVDVIWENLIALKISKFLTANITTTLLYDDDIDISWIDKSGKEHYGPTTQFKEVFGIGLSYKF